MEIGDAKEILVKVAFALQNWHTLDSDRKTDAIRALDRIQDNLNKLIRSRRRNQRNMEKRKRHSTSTVPAVKDESDVKEIKTCSNSVAHLNPNVRERIYLSKLIELLQIRLQNAWKSLNVGEETFTLSQVKDMEAKLLAFKSEFREMFIENRAATSCRSSRTTSRTNRNILWICADGSKYTKTSNAKKAYCLRREKACTFMQNIRFAWDSYRCNRMDLDAKNILKVKINKII